MSQSHPSERVLHHGGQRVLLHHKDVGGLALHREAVGLTVEAHGTNKVLELREQVGELRSKHKRAGQKTAAVHDGKPVKQLTRVRISLFLICAASLQINSNTDALVLHETQRAVCENLPWELLGIYWKLREIYSNIFLLIPRERVSNFPFGFCNPRCELTMKPNTTVEKKPPMKPSQVFLGESCRDRDRGVFMRRSLTSASTTCDLIGEKEQQHLFIFHTHTHCLIHLDQWSPAEEEAEQVGHDVVADDDGDRDDEPGNRKFHRGLEEEEEEETTGATEPKPGGC